MNRDRLAERLFITMASSDKYAGSQLEDIAEVAFKAADAFIMRSSQALSEEERALVKKWENSEFVRTCA